MFFIFIFIVLLFTPSCFSGRPQFPALSTGLRSCMGSIQAPLSPMLLFPPSTVINGPAFVTTKEDLPYPRSQPHLSLFLSFAWDIAGLSWSSNLLLPRSFVATCPLSLRKYFLPLFEMDPSPRVVLRRLLPRAPSFASFFPAVVSSGACPRGYCRCSCSTHTSTKRTRACESGPRSPSPTSWPSPRPRCRGRTMGLTPPPK